MRGSSASNAGRISWTSAQPCSDQCISIVPLPPGVCRSYSLALADGGSARDISRPSGFPKNTLSRAIKRLELMGLIDARDKAPGGSRTQALHLSEKGWALIHETRPAFEAQEQRMLTSLSDGERQMLFELLSKVVLDAESWADSLPPQAVTGNIHYKEGKAQ